MFSLLYFAQGSIIGYFTALNALYLLSFDVPMTKIGMFAAIALIPFMLKIFLGMLSDKVNLFGLGHRKPYIIIGLLLQAGGQLVFPFIDPVSQFPLLTAVAFLSLTGMSLYDTCTDGLALDTTPHVEVGMVEGIMVSGRAAGIVIIAITVGILSQQANWMAVFIALAVITLVPLPMILFYKEPKQPKDRSFDWSAFKAFGKKSVIALAFLGLISTMVTGGANQLVNPFLKDTFGISYMMAGFFTAFWGVGVILGGLTGGRLTDRLGHRRSVIIAMAISLITILLLSVISGHKIAWPILLFFGISYGLYEAVYFGASMDMTDKRIAASMYAIMMAIANTGSGLGMAIGGKLSDSIGYRWTFVFFAGLNLLIIPLLPVIFGKRKRG